MEPSARRAAEKVYVAVACVPELVQVIRGETTSIDATLPEGEPQLLP